MKMQQYQLTSDDDVKLAYFTMGEGPAIVLLAGYGAPAISWVRQMKTLSKAGYRAIALDRRCHGLSEHTSKGLNMLRHGQDVNCLFETLDLHDAVLIGQSQGASTVWSYISQFGTSRLKAAVSVDQTPKMVNDGDWLLGMYGLDIDTRPTFFDKPLPNPTKKSIAPDILLYILQHKKEYPEFPMELTKPLLLDHADADWRETIEKTEVPVLFINGGESPFWPPAHGEAMAKLAKNGKFVVIPGSGHAVNWECPKEFDKALLAFLSGLGT